jgi:acyl carrier protein
MSTSELQPTQPSTTVDQIEKIVRDLIGDDDIVLSPETRPNDVEGWDSLANVSIIFALEEEFGVAFGDEVLAGFETIGELVVLIDRARGSAA